MTTVLLTVEATEHRDSRADPFGQIANWGDLPLPAGVISIRGQTLTPNPTNPAIGTLLLQLPANSTNDVTPVVTKFYNQNNYTFDVKAEEVKIEMEWIALPTNLPVEENNNPITGVPMPGGGNRIYVGAKTPTENVYRNTVYLKIKTTPALAGLPIYLKSFDVDDATPANFDSSNLIDSNGALGDDNYDDFLGTPKTGLFVLNNQPTITVLTDQDGEAQAEFKVGMQPGNNYRVAAAWKSSDLDNLQVNNPVQSLFYVTADTNALAGLNGVVSPMLTVWRKLHIEVDSMEAVATNGAEANFIEKLVTYYGDVPNTNQSVVNFSIALPGGDDSYENGRMEAVGFPPYPVLNNYGGTTGAAKLDGQPGNTVVSNFVSFFDDDDRFLSTIGLPPALPKDNESTNIIEGIRSVFFPAYIDVTNANAEGLNPNKRIAFKLNQNPGTAGGPFTDAKDVNDSNFFWAHTVVLAYQAEAGHDQDPNLETPYLGLTREQSSLFGINPGVSAIYVELIREANDSLIKNYINNTNVFPYLIGEYNKWIFGITAHEIGHYPGRQGETADHEEDGLMNAAGQTIIPFTSPTIKRFRSAPSWSN